MIKKYCEQCKTKTIHHKFMSGQTQCLKCGIGDKKNPELEKERLTKMFLNVKNVVEIWTPKINLKD